MDIAGFCPACGAGTEEGSSFCTTCGALITPSGTNKNPAHSLNPALTLAIQHPGSPDCGMDPPEEKVILVVPNLMRIRGLGLFLRGPVWHHLVFTTQRIIIVQRTLGRWEKLKQDLGVLGPDFYYKTLMHMKPCDILAEYPESRAIVITDLVSLTVSRFVARSPEDPDEYHWQVRIQTTRSPVTLRTDTNEDPGNYFRNPALMQLLGNRLITRDM